MAGNFAEYHGNRSRRSRFSDRFAPQNDANMIPITRYNAGFVFIFPDGAESQHASRLKIREKCCVSLESCNDDVNIVNSLNDKYLFIMFIINKYLIFLLQLCNNASTIFVFLLLTVCKIRVEHPV